jgi:hypothetical protein
MLLVEIEKPENERLSAWFSGLREWLDLNRCKPSTFAPSGRRIDRLIYRISFEDAALAHQFSVHFARYSPIVRRATSFERDQLRALAARETAASEPLRHEETERLFLGHEHDRALTRGTIEPHVVVEADAVQPAANRDALSDAG